MMMMMMKKKTKERKEETKIHKEYHPNLTSEFSILANTFAAKCMTTHVHWYIYKCKGEKRYLSSIIFSVFIFRASYSSGYTARE